VKARSRVTENNRPGLVLG